MDIIGSNKSIYNRLNYCKTNKMYHTGQKLGFKFMEVYPWDLNIAIITADLLYLDEKYNESFNILKKSIKMTTDEKTNELILHKMKLTYEKTDNSIKTNNEMIIKSNLNLITFVTTTCKRLNLFMNTMNSFLNNCIDKNLISEWICIDDNSSKEDIDIIKQNFPFLKIISKDYEDKGHARSLNILRHCVRTPYLFLLEDDWTIINNISLVNLLEVVNQDDKYGQCLINQYYTETLDDWNVCGGTFHKTIYGNNYIKHCFKEIDDCKKFGGKLSSIYWPYFSLRPGLTKMNIINEIGNFNENANHFEMDFAYKYANKGYKTCFIPGINSIHTGRLTKDINSDKLNAYKLNNEEQFTKKTITNRVKISNSKLNYYYNMIYPTNIPKIDETGEDTKLFMYEKPKIKVDIIPKYKNIIVNMKNRTDRKQFMQKQISKHNQNYIFYEAINGNNVKKTHQLYQIFENNDYNFRCGMIGCALSHIAIWYNLLLDKSADMYIILEDDITFVDDYERKLQYIINNSLNDNWEIMFLGHFLRNNIKETDEVIPSWSKWTRNQSLTKSLGGTIGYMINKQGALKMIKYIEKIGMTNCIDTMMQKAANDINVFYLNSHIIHSECYRGDNKNSLDTDIQFNFNNLYKSFEQRLQEEIEFFIKYNIDYELINKEQNQYSDNKVYLAPSNIILPFDYKYTLGKLNVWIPNKILNDDIKYERSNYKLQQYNKEKKIYEYTLDMI